MQSVQRISGIGRLVWLIAVVMFALSACGGGSDEVSKIDVATLVSDDAVRDVVVEGAVVWDDGGARLCQALMESFPAQCGAPSVPISNPDAVDASFDESGGVRWTPSFVVLTGQYNGSQLTIG